MAEKRPLERLTASDLFLLLWHDYGWFSDIGGLAILDGGSLLDRHGRVQIEAVRRHTEPRLAAVPRFRQLLPGLPQRRVGALLRLHHALADGAAGRLRGAAGPEPRRAHPGRTAPAADADPDRRCATARQPPSASAGARSRVVRPRPTAKDAPRDAGGPARVAAGPHRTADSTDQPQPPVGGDRRLAVIRGRLDLTKEIAHVHHAKVNDVVLAAVAGGLRELLASRGEDVRGLMQRAMVTISLHDEQPWEAQGNKPGWMMVPLPIDEPDPGRRLARIATETARRKQEARPQAGSGISGSSRSSACGTGSSRGSGR
jgi:hypothetical protein